MGDVAKAAGVGHSIEFRGKKYELKPETPEMIGRFEVWLEGRALAAAKRIGRQLSPAEARQLMRDTARDVACDVYGYGSEQYAESSRKMAGFRHRLLLSIQAGDPSADEALIAAMTDDKNDPETFAECVRLMNLRDGTTGGDDDASNDPGDGGE